MGIKKIIGIALILGLCLLSHSALAGDDWIMETDNHDATFTGIWSTSIARLLYYGDNYRATPCSGNTATTTATATFLARTAVDVSGNYSVFAMWAVDPNRSEAAPYEIYEDDGDTTPMATVYANQEGHGGEWRLLGTYFFHSGSRPKVILKNNAATEADGCYVIADAVRWVKENIGRGDTVDEAGVEYSNHLTVAGSTLSVCDTYTDIATVIVLAPRSGYIIVNATGPISPPTVTGGKYLRIGLGNTSAGTSVDSWPHYFASYHDLSISHVYPVSTSATYTYYLKACRQDASTEGTIYVDSFNAIYVPTNY